MGAFLCSPLFFMLPGIALLITLHRRQRQTLPTTSITSAPILATTSRVAHPTADERSQLSSGLLEQVHVQSNQLGNPTPHGPRLVRQLPRWALCVSRPLAVWLLLFGGLTFGLSVWGFVS